MHKTVDMSEFLLVDIFDINIKGTLCEEMGKQYLISCRM